MKESTFLFFLVYHILQVLMSNGVDHTFGDLLCYITVKLCPEEIQVSMLLQEWSKFMSLWIMQVNNLSLLGTVNPLELESEKRHLERSLIVTGNLVLAFAPYLSEQILHVLTILVYKLMGFLKANAFDAFQVITAR